MPRFVLLYHDCPPEYTKPSHWDLMFEFDDVLLTWELRELPSAWQEALGWVSTSKSQSVPATRLRDHRLEYLTIEGPLTENRGSVMRVAEGTFETMKLEENKLVVSLEGETVSGIVTLFQTAAGETWQLCMSD